MKIPEHGHHHYHQPFGEHCPQFLIDDEVSQRLEDVGDPYERLYFLWCECRAVIREPVLKSTSGVLEEFYDWPPPPTTISVEDLPVVLDSKFAGHVEIRRAPEGSIVVRAVPT